MRENRLSGLGGRGSASPLLLPSSRAAARGVDMLSPGYWLHP